VDVLVNNAGLYLIKPLTETTVEEWNNLMAVNVTGVFLGMKHAAPSMAERGGGSIVNMSSVAGLMGVAGARRGRGKSKAGGGREDEGGGRGRRWLPRLRGTPRR
jgi:NAD(P)-dependent dehydrogenase (short-subunit alcohol dehydrogenase family)